MTIDNEYIRKSEVFRKEAIEAVNKGIYWLACFHAHQAVEFFLKGLLEHETGSYPFSHDLGYLLLSLAMVLNLEVPEDIKLKCDALSPHYTLSRYGGRGVSEYDKKKGEDCIRYMEDVLGWLRGVV